MSIIKSARKTLAEERRKNEALTAALAKAKADLEYVAMMADVELEETDEE